MRTFARDGLVFDVTDGGPRGAAAVVLLHGFPQHRHCWDAVSPLLHAQDLRTLAPDQRGYSPGARPVGIRSYAIAELVQDAVALLDAAEVERANVVGHDWGAAVAWGLAIRHPDRVASVVSVSIPHPSAMVQAAWTGAQALRSWYIGLFGVPGLAERLLDPAHPGGRGRLMRVMTDAGLTDDEAASDLDLLASPGAFTAALSWYRALPLAAADRGPTRVGVPAALVWGDRDTAIDRRGVETTGRYVDAPYRLDVLVGRGHWIPQHAPEAVAAAVAWAVGQAADRR